jgi:hypothetical protein
MSENQGLTKSAHEQYVLSESALAVRTYKALPNN